MVILQKRRKEIEGIINKKVKRVSLKNEQREKRERKFQLFFENMRRKKEEEELTDEVPRLARQPLWLRARGQGRRKISLWREKLNFQSALFLCSSSVTLFKFAPLCCLFVRNSVSLLCKTTSRSPLKAKSLERSGL